MKKAPDFPLWLHIRGEIHAKSNIWLFQGITSKSFARLIIPAHAGFPFVYQFYWKLCLNLKNLYSKSWSNMKIDIYLNHGWLQRRNAKSRSHSIHVKCALFLIPTKISVLQTTVIKIQMFQMLRCYLLFYKHVGKFVPQKIGLSRGKLIFFAELRTQ